MMNLLCGSFKHPTFTLQWLTCCNAYSAVEGAEVIEEAVTGVSNVDKSSYAEDH